jgi:hypothetical protein
MRTTFQAETEAHRRDLPKANRASLCGDAPEYQHDEEHRRDPRDRKASGLACVCRESRSRLFQLVELWLEDTFLLEVMTPEQTARLHRDRESRIYSEVLRRAG